MVEQTHATPQTHAENDTDYDSDASTDTQGSLCDFIVGNEDEEVEEEEDEGTVDLSFDVQDYGTSINAQGLRRSRRRRNTVNRYQDPAFRRLMLDDVEMDGWRKQ